MNWEFSKGECCSEGKIVTSDDKKQKDKPKLVPHQNVQVAGEKVKRKPSGRKSPKGNLGAKTSGS